MTFVQISSFDNYVTANLQLSMLQEEGIHCYLKDEYTITIDPLLSPAIGGMKLMVADSQSERALSILQDAAEKFLQTCSCPKCGNFTLEYITEITSPVGLWEKIKCMVINGQPREVKKFYRCLTCKSVFDEIPGNP